MPYASSAGSSTTSRGAWRFSSRRSARRATISSSARRCFPCSPRRSAGADDWAAASRHLQKAIELAERSGGACAHLPRPARVSPGPRSGRTGSRRSRAPSSSSGLFRTSCRILTARRFLQGVVLLAVDRFDDARRLLEESYERALALGHAYRLVHLGWLADLELRAGNWQQALVHARASRGARPAVRQRRRRGLGSLVESAGRSASRERRCRRRGRGARVAPRSCRRDALGGDAQRARARLRPSLRRPGGGGARHLLPLLQERAGVSLHRSQMARTLVERDRGTRRHRRARPRQRAWPNDSSSMPARCPCRRRSLPPRAPARSCSPKTETSRAHAPRSRPRSPHTRASASPSSSRGPIWRRARSSVGRNRRPRRAQPSGELRRSSPSSVRRLWLERTRRDLARTGLTRSLDRELTPTELRVAELAATGAQNKEIAGALFVSVKTVEANLSRVYAKLGIRSRVELPDNLSNPGQPTSRQATER